MSSARLPAVDAYLAKAQPFAQPILLHLRDTMHRAAPGVQEAMKWSRPFFVYKGVILGNLAAFKAHCSFGLWGTEMAQLLRADGTGASDGMGSFGRITAMEDLPPQDKLEGYVRQAASFIDRGARTKSIQRVAKPAPRPAGEIPPALAQALQTNPAAAAKFTLLSPSCRREYVEWIAEAKREDTRSRRLKTALAMIMEGKPRHWKYQQSAQGTSGFSSPARRPETG